jgi:hypothetical protein
MGRSRSLPLRKIAPARTRATKCGALTARQRACAARDPGPLATLVLKRTVVKVLSIGLVVRKWT